VTSVLAARRDILMLDLSTAIDPIIANCPPPPVVSPPESWLWHIIVWALCLACLGLGILLGRMSREK
jgi:hypothetical protein